MVGPSMTEDDRRILSGRLRLGFVLLVAVSGGLVAIQADAGLPAIALATLAGGLVGAGLLWYLVRIAPWGGNQGGQ